MRGASGQGGGQQLTSSSWLNLVEGWFTELTNRKLRRSAHRSLVELERACQWPSAPD